MEFNFETVEPSRSEEGSPKQDASKETFIQSKVPFHLLQYLPFCSNGSKLQNVCRICLSTIEDNKVSLLSVYDNKMLIELLKSFTAVHIVEVYPDDDLPSYMCETCHSDIIYCYQFKLKCEDSESMLQGLQRNQIISEKSEEKDLKIQKENIQEEVKEEMVIEEYLEDINDFSSCNEDNNGENTTDNQLNFHETDPDSHLKAVTSKDKALSKQYTCNFCFKKFSRVKALRAHITKKHKSEEHSHPCNQCKEGFNSEHDLQVHSAVHTTGPLWSCNQCVKSFKARSQLRRHLQRHMQAKRFACDSCDKTFSELYALRRHTRVHTGEAKEKKFACQLCDKKYSENSQLVAHEAWHRGERRCVCAACGKAFASARLLASHRLVHSDDKPYACTYCDKRFRHESTRNTHHRTHTGEKPYVCAACGKTFIQNSNLTLHMRTHTGERPYSCDKCDRKFTTGSSLKAHQRRHTGEKPYGCTLCGKRFAWRDLHAHARLHAGARAHACRACPKRFASAARLRDHTRMHTGEKPFECATCMQTFSTKSHLVKHLKKHQPKKKPEKSEVLIVQHLADYNTPVFVNDKYIITDGEQIQQTSEEKLDANNACEETKNMTLEITPQVPMEVTGELVVQDNCDVKEILVVDNSQNDANYQTGNICINTDGVNYVNSDVNLVTVNEGTTVKLYQLDQSLVQIHSSGGQVTISKITSKMTANF